MSEDQSAGGASQDSGGIDSKKDTVAYDTYKKAVSEAKRAKEEAAALKAEIETREKGALAEQNKFKELWEKSQKDLQAKDTEIKNMKSSVFQNNLKNVVKSVAKDLGAIEPALDDIYTIVRNSDLLKGMEVTEDFSLDAGQLKQKLAEFAKSRDHLFVKKAAAPKDIVMGGDAGGSSTVTVKDLSKLSMDQLKELGARIK